MNKKTDEVSAAVGEYAIGASRYLASILMLGHLAVAATLLWLDFSFNWKAAVLTLLVVSVIYELRLALRLSASAIVAFSIARSNELSVRTRRGDWRPCQVLDSTYVTVFLTVVNLRVAQDRRIRSVVILPDCMAADDYRRLRVWLRWRPQTESP